MNKNLITVKDYAKQMNINIGTVYKRISNDDIQYVIFQGKKYVVTDVTQDEVCKQKVIQKQQIILGLKHKIFKYEKETFDNEIKINKLESDLDTMFDKANDLKKDYNNYRKKTSVGLNTINYMIFYMTILISINSVINLII